MPCRPNKTACECGWICIISLMGNISNGSLKVIGPAVKPGALGRLAVFISPAERGILRVGTHWALGQTSQSLQYTAFLMLPSSSGHSLRGSLHIKYHIFLKTNRLKESFVETVELNQNDLDICDIIHRPNKN